jgi:hypothetical protein
MPMRPIKKFILLAIVASLVSRLLRGKRQSRRAHA